MSSIWSRLINLNGNVTGILPELHGGTGVSSFTQGSVIFAGATTLAQDNANFNWDDTNFTLGITQPSSLTALADVVVITSDPGGNHGHGNHLNIAGNPGGGGTIFRTDGGLNKSWLQIYGGDSTGTTGGQLYVNGNNSTDGDAGGIQVAVGLQGAYFQILDNTQAKNLLTVTDDGANGLVNILSLTASTAVVTDGSQNLASSATTATEIGYVHGVTSAIQTQINSITGSAVTSLTGDVTGTGPGATATTVAKIQGVTVSGTTGTGNVVFSTSPTLITPALGTPSALVGTNITGTAAGLTAGITDALASASTTVNVSSAIAPTNGQVLTATSGTAATWQTPASGSAVTSLTGDVTGTGPGATATTVAKIQGVTVSGTTGTGNVVFSNSPSLVTPALGVPASGNLSNCTSYPVVVPGTTAGLVSSNGVPGNTSGSAITAGYVGELISSTAAGSGVTVGATPTQLTTVSIPAGVWLVCVSVNVKETNGATNHGSFAFGTTANSYTGTTLGYDQFNIGIPLASTVDGMGSFSLLISIGTTTSYYLNCQSDQGTAGTGDWLGSISAVRVA